jgi:hypothetical protein
MGCLRFLCLTVLCIGCISWQVQAQEEVYPMYRTGCIDQVKSCRKLALTTAQQGMRECSKIRKYKLRRSCENKVRSDYANAKKQCSLEGRACLKQATTPAECFRGASYVSKAEHKIDKANFEVCYYTSQKKYAQQRALCRSTDPYSSCRVAAREIFQSEVAACRQVRDAHEQITRSNYFSAWGFCKSAGDPVKASCYTQCKQASYSCGLGVTALYDQCQMNSPTQPSSSEQSSSCYYNPQVVASRDACSHAYQACTDACG